MSSSFEVAHDATPKPEPAEAAFLESIPDPLGNKPAAHVPEILGASQKTKSPWQPLSGAIGETKTSEPGTNPELGSVSTGRRPFSTGLSSGAGTAAAPARAKETLAPAIKTAKPAASDVSTLHTVHETLAENSKAEFPKDEATGDAPHFAASAHETKSSKMPLIAAIVVIAIGAAGYFGWSKMHIGHSPSVAQEPTAASVGSSATASPVKESGQEDEELVLQSPAAPAQPQSATMQSQPTASQSQPTTRLNQQATQSATATPVSGKPAPGKAAAVTPDSGDEATSAPAKKAPEGLTVKSEPVVVEEKPVIIDQTIAPPPLQVASVAGDKTIAGLVGNTPLPMPKRAPEILKVSQGITEGMLLTRVKPIYPPQAVQMHKQGMVLLSANISKNGSISDTKLIKGDPILAQAALAAVKQWKYKPYTLNGQPIDVQTQIAVNFKLP